MANTIDEYNGQIKIEVTLESGEKDYMLVNPCYWDEETNDWKDADFNVLGLTNENIQWIADNYTEENKTKFKQIFIASKE